MKKDVNIVIFAFFCNMAFASVLSGRSALTMTLQKPYPNKSGFGLSVLKSTSAWSKLLTRVYEGKLQSGIAGKYEGFDMDTGTRTIFGEMRMD